MMQSGEFSPDPRNVLTVHASAVRIDDEALVFLGPSGTGKSTICSLLTQHLEPLVDDLVGLIPCDTEKWVVFDAQQHPIPKTDTKTQFIIQKPPILKAIFRLRQSSLTNLSQITPQQTCHYLIDAFFEARWQRYYNIEIKKVAFATLARVARVVPGYKLNFSLSGQVFKAINTAICRKEFSF